ncbi:MAG: homocysteine S-methyltransferase [Liquorilactobacillus nagelii]
MKSPLNALLEKQKVLVLDGAMATELEKAGVDTANELWSATALLAEPEKITAVHASYFAAGSQIATTNTYQANLPAFIKNGLSEASARQLIKQAVQCAQTAVKSSDDTNLLIAGSIGPYGAYLADGSEYTGAYQKTQAEYQAFHYPRMAALVAAGVDLLAFETQPNFAETQALISLLKDKFPQLTAWVSFSIKDEGHLCDGTDLIAAAQYAAKLPQISAIGVNCTALENIEPALHQLQTTVSKPLIVYPNNGDRYNPQTKKWQVNPQADSFSDLVPRWIAAGAKIIGGCCRTSPADIQEIATTVKSELAK